MTDEKHFQVTRHDDVTVLHLDTQILDRMVILDLRDALIEFIETEKPAKLLINFDQVKRFSSEAIGALISARKRVKGHGGQIKLCGTSPDIRMLFKITDLDGNLFEIYDSCREASESFE